MDEWILHTVNDEPFDYNTEAWVGKAISKGMMKKHQNTKCFNCGRIIGHLRGIVNKAFLEKKYFLWE